MRFPFEPDATEILARLDRPTGEWVLRRRVLADGRERHEIVQNGRLLMDTADGESEAALARVGLARCAARARVGVDALVGGLGFGFTLRALLDDPRVRSIEVVELEPALPGLLARLGRAQGLADARVRLAAGDVGAHLAAAEARWDLVLLDVDNGPEAPSAAGNEALYTSEALARCRRALRPGGVVCIWSAEPSPGCLARLRRVFGEAAEERVPAVRDGRALDYRVLWSARPP